MPVKAKLKGQGVYITQKEFHILKNKIPYLAIIKKLSKEEKAVFNKIRKGIKHLDSRQRFEKDIWLTPQNAKLLVAWKETALKTDLIRRGKSKGSLLQDPIVENWERLFNEKVSPVIISSQIQELKNKKKIDLGQANVSIIKTKKQAYLSKKDVELIKLRLIDKLEYADIAKKWGKRYSTVHTMAKKLRRLGINV